MSQSISLTERSRLLWILKLERQEALQGVPVGWVPVGAERKVAKKFLHLGFIKPVIIPGLGCGYQLTKAGAQLGGN
jgi:hypothetical protein